MLLILSSESESGGRTQLNVSDPHNSVREVREQFRFIQRRGRSV